MRALRHIRNALTDDSVKSNACALVGSRLDNANSVLIGASTTNVAKLQRLQNSLVRIVTRQRGRTGTTQALATLHWLPVKWRIDFKVATLTYKLLSTGQPSYLVNSVSIYIPGRSLRSTDILTVSRTKTVIGARTFRSAAPSVWNKLPVDIRNSTSLLTFRCRLKTHFFRLALD